MYGLTPEDLELQGRARMFADELIQHEVEAEPNDGRCPPSSQAHHQRAIELGLYATNMPTSVGGQGCTALQQVLVQEQAGRVTNGIAWCMHTPPGVVAGRSRTTTSATRWLLPTVRGEKHECYAITEEHAGSDVADIRATARRTATPTCSTGRSGT